MNFPSTHQKKKKKVIFSDIFIFQQMWTKKVFVKTFTDYIWTQRDKNIPACVMNDSKMLLLSYNIWI